mgnify:CR=1 FL=1
MTGTSTLTSKGQATIPEPLRSYLGLMAGDKVHFEIDTKEQVVKLKKAPKIDVANQTYGSLKSPVKQTNYAVAREAAAFMLGAKYQSK